MPQSILKPLVWSWVEKRGWWRSYSIAEKWVKQRHHGCPKGLRWWRIITAASVDAVFSPPILQGKKLRGRCC